MSNLKIILSPSKTQHVAPIAALREINLTQPIHLVEAQMLTSELKRLDKVALGHCLKVKGKKLDEAFSFYNDFEQQPAQAAIGLYSGSVFKALNLDGYNEQELLYLNTHTLILSALYGVLKPFDQVKPYRLDMGSKVFPEGAKAFWSEKYTAALRAASPIVNLASDEFSQLIDLPMIRIAFKEQDSDGKLIIKSTYAKMARGAMAQFAVVNQVVAAEEMKLFNWQGYSFSKVHSTEVEWTFIRDAASVWQV